MAQDRKNSCFVLFLLALSLLSVTMACSSSVNEENPAAPTPTTETSTKKTANASPTSKPRSVPTAAVTIPTSPTEIPNVQSSKSSNPTKSPEPIVKSTVIISPTVDVASGPTVVAKPLPTPGVLQNPKDEITSTQPKETLERRTTLPELPPAPVPQFTYDDIEETFPEAVTESLSNALHSEFESHTQKMGISAAVYKQGMAWSDASGFADVGIPMTTTTPTRLMSTSKTFLAALVMTQIAEGLYSLDDQVSVLLGTHKKYQTLNKNIIPDVTIRQLLTMRSGVLGTHRDSGKVATGKTMMYPTWDPIDSLKLAQTLAEPPGTYKYSPIANSYLLGIVAEEKGNNDLLTLYQTTLLDPLNINVGLLPITETPKDLAAPFAERSKYGGPQGFGDLSKIKMYTSYGLDFQQSDGRLSWAGAGIISTSATTARWAYELLSPHGTAIGKQALSDLSESFVDEWISLNEPRQQYGYHLVSTEYELDDGRLILTYGHPGGGSGYSSLLYYVPSLDVAISIQANTEISHTIGTCADHSRDGLRQGLSPLGCIGIAFLEILSDEFLN